jgi:hypothetical protein
MLKKGGGLFVAGAVAAVLLATSHSFSFAPPQQSQRCSALSLAEQDDNIIIQELESTNDVTNRRGFLSQIAASASASLLLSSSLPQQANALPDEPTRIEISVDTEYLIRVLDYFDGDMRKALGVLIRAPSTQVEIDAPARAGSGSINPRDAVLNALSSYNEEEYAVQQASWVKVDKPNRTLELLLKKRYTLSLPSVGSAGNAEQVEIVLKDGGTVKYKPSMKIEKTSLSLSNLEAGIGLVTISYPVAYGLYNYESFREEEEKKLKKAQMAAKKAKAAAAKKAKAKGSPKKKEKKTTTVEKSKPTMKGQETKKPPIDASVVDVNFNAASKEAEWFQSETALLSKIENKKEKEPEFEWWKNKETSPAEEATPAEVDGDSSKGTEWFGRDVSETAVMELMQEVQQQGGYLDSLSKSQSSQSASPPPYKRKQAASKKKSSSSFSSYLDSL